MHAHLCNVYDNLPTDKVAFVDGQIYHVEARMYLPCAALQDLLQRHGFAAEDRPGLEDRLRSLRNRTERGVEDLLEWARQRLCDTGKPSLAYVAFWMDLVAELRLEERYVAVEDISQLPLSHIPGFERADELLRRHLSGNRGAPVHLNQEALAGFTQLLEMLHPHGVLEVVDLFVQRIEEYEHRFKGPAKYDGSTVNWLNGPLFREVAERLGYHVRFNGFKPFDHKSASVIMLASADVQVPEGTAG